MSESDNVRDPENYAYLVKDGRARLDMGRAVVLEVFGEIDGELALTTFLREYKSPGIDSVLVRYELKGSCLHSPKIIDSLEDLE